MSGFPARVVPINGWKLLAERDLVKFWLYDAPRRERDIRHFMPGCEKRRAIETDLVARWEWFWAECLARDILDGDCQEK